jgi:hydrogenase-4 component B
MTVLWPGASLQNISSLEWSWLIFTAVLWLIATLYKLRMPDHRPQILFWVFWTVSCAGNLLLIAAQDVLGFYIGFSMMSLGAYALVIHSGKPAARRAGRVYLQLAILGEMALLTSLLISSHANNGSLLLSDWQQSDISPVAAILLLIGLGLKAGFWPLHVWLPLAHPAAPAPASAVLSGAMIKAGILGLWKIMPETAIPGQAALLLMALAIFSAVYGVIAGLMQHQVKRILAYSSVSQVSYLLFLVALAWLMPAQRHLIAVALTIYTVHHGLIKGSLFIAADFFSTRSHSLAVNKVNQALLLVAALAIAGLPMTSGMAAKSALKSLLDGESMALWYTLISVGSVATSVIIIKILLSFRTLHVNATVQPTDPLKATLWWTLSLSAIALPWLWPDMRQPLVSSLTADKLWAASWPILLSGFIYWVWPARWTGELTGINRIGRCIPYLSTRIKQAVNRLAAPQTNMTVSGKGLRKIERRWNRLWQGNTVNISALLLIAVMLLTGALMYP